MGRRLVRQVAECFERRGSVGSSLYLRARHVPPSYFLPVPKVKPSHIVEISLRESTAQGFRQILGKACYQMISIDCVRFALLPLLDDSLADLPIGLN